MENVKQERDEKSQMEWTEEMGINLKNFRNEYSQWEGEHDYDLSYVETNVVNSMLRGDVSTIPTYESFLDCDGHDECDIGRDDLNIPTYTTYVLHYVGQ